MKSFIDKSELHNHNVEIVHINKVKIKNYLFSWSSNLNGYVNSGIAPGTRVLMKNDSSFNNSPAWIEGTIIKKVCSDVYMVLNTDPTSDYFNKIAFRKNAMIKIRSNQNQTTE